MDGIIIPYAASSCEYYCYHCGQLRLSPGVIPTSCGFCGNTDIEIGPVGSLDKQALIRKMNGSSR